MSTRPIPEHGTRACYLRGCRRNECSDANRRYCKQYRNKTHQTGHATRIPSAPVTARIQHWLSLDYTYGQIAAATGSSHQTIIYHARGDYPTIHPRVAKRILSTCLGADSIPGSVPVDSTGTVRRLQAMAAVGHTFRAISTEINVHPDAISRIANSKHATVLGSTARRVAELYRRWSHVPGRSLWCRNMAASKGWHGPLAWDDIDNPNEQPDANDTTPMGMRELAELNKTEIVLLATAGASPEEIAARTHLSKDYVRERFQQELPTTYRELANRQKRSPKKKTNMRRAA